MLPIILASQSPRRSDLLEQAGIPFTVVAGDFDEKAVPVFGTAQEYAERLAEEKAVNVKERCDKGLILAADTIVVLGAEIFGKPEDRREARNMLNALSGREHLVITGISLLNTETGMLVTGSEVTRVKFAKLKQEEIESYINTGEPFGKAGGYAVQGRGELFVEEITGSFSNVVGLPLQKLRNMLADCGIDIMAYWENIC